MAGKLDSELVRARGVESVCLPFMDYNKYLDLLSRVDLSIAPLERNPFNEAKSAVKLIESTVVGTPILVSENQDMRDHNNQLSTLVKDNDDWADVFDTALRDKQGVQSDAGFTPAEEFSVQARLPILQQHLTCAA